jgi:hypothetical protein
VGSSGAEVGGNRFPNNHFTNGARGKGNSHRGKEGTVAKVLALFFFATTCFSQIVRVDPNPITTTAGNVPIGAFAPLLSIPGSTVQICNDSSCATAATTYTDGTGQVLCPTTAQLVLASAKLPSCVSTTDQQGNFGFWIAAGQYFFRITIPNGTVYGPSPFSTAGSGNWLTIANPPFYDSRTFNWQQQPGGTLTASVAATVSLIPCPLGVLGAGVAYQTYLTAGAGASETVVVTGGTCTSGKAFGTLQFTPAFSHSGAWKIGSVMSGVPEAIQFAYAAGGGTVAMPNGATNAYGTAYLMPHVTLVGWGSQASIIKPQSCFMLVFGFANLAPQPPASGYPYNAYSSPVMKDFIVDGSSCDGINGITAIGAYVGSDTTTTAFLWGLKIDNVWLNNVGNGIHLERTWDTVLTHVRTFANTRVVFTDTAAGFAAFQHSSQLLVTDFNYDTICTTSTQCSVATMTAAAFECDACTLSTIRDGNFGGAGPNDTINVAMKIAGDSEKVTIDNINFEVFGTQLSIAAGLYGGGQAWPSFGVINNCAFDNPYGTAIKFENGNSPYSFQRVGNWMVTNSAATVELLTNMSDLVIVGAWSANMTFVNNNFGCNNGQNCLHVGAFSIGTIIDANQFFRPADFPGTSATGILVDSAAGAHTITNNGFTYLTSAQPLVDNSLGLNANANTVICGNTPSQIIPQTCPISTMFTVEKISNGAVFQNDNSLYTCVSATGCWATQNYANPLTNVAAANSQTITLIPTLGISAGAYVTQARIKSITYNPPFSSCVGGPSTVTASLGTSANPTFFFSPYPLHTNVTSSNFAPANGALNNTGSALAQDSVTVNFVSTGGTLDAVPGACQMYIWMTYQILPGGIH